MSENYDGAYQNFVFMAGWRDVLEGFEKEFGAEYAREALWNLMLVGTLEGQEPVTDKQSIRGFVNGCIKPVMKSSNKNYNKNKENGMKGGRPTIDVDMELAYKIYAECGRWKDTAQKLGVSVDKLRAARKEYDKQKNSEELIVSEAEQVYEEDLSRKTEKPKNSEKKPSFYF